LEDVNEAMGRSIACSYIFGEKWLSWVELGINGRWKMKFETVLDNEQYEKDYYIVLHYPYRSAFPDVSMFA
jgi:hypothetical protein